MKYSTLNCIKIFFTENTAYSQVFESILNLLVDLIQLLCLSNALGTNVKRKLLMIQYLLFIFSRNLKYPINFYANIFLKRILIEVASLFVLNLRDKCVWRNKVKINYLSFYFDKNVWA